MCNGESELINFDSDPISGEIVGDFNPGPCRKRNEKNQVWLLEKKLELVITKIIQMRDIM